MPLISVAADTSHAPMSWSKEEASKNMPRMLVAADTSHDPMSWSKEEALSNMDFILETADVSHAEMSGLHVSLPVVEPPPLHHGQALNRHCMSVIALTSQPEMSPYVARAAASSLHQRSTAACRAGLSAKVPRVGGEEGGGEGGGGRGGSGGSGDGDGEGGEGG